MAPKFPIPRFSIVAFGHIGSRTSPFDAYDIIDLFSDGIGPIDDVVSTLGSVIETPPGFFDYSDMPARACV